MELSHGFDGFPPQNPKDPESETRAFDEPRRERIMGMLRDSVFRRLSDSNRFGHIGQNLKFHVDKQLHRNFPSFATPSHPPYASMIQTAIMELNEERGSSEESISGFIEKNYEGLPRGHATFLSHHLRKLCQTGEIVCKIDGRYMIAVNQTRLLEEFQLAGHEIDVINERSKVRNKQVAVFEKWHQVRKRTAKERNNPWKQDTRSEEQIQRPSVQLYENGPDCQLVKLNEESNHLQELQFEVSDKHALACMQQNTVIVEQNIPEELHEKRNDDGIIVSLRNASETTVQCLNCDGLSTSVEEKQLQEQNGKFIREESRPQEHHIEHETNILKFCCVNGNNHSENSWVSLGDSSLPVQRKEFLKQQQRTVWGERKIVIICGLPAQRLLEPKIYSQQKVQESFLGNRQQQPLQGMTMAVALPSDWQHDIEQHHKQQLEVRGRVRPSTTDADAFNNGSLRIYVRRKHKA